MMKNTKKLILSLIVFCLLFALSGLAGCGQKISVVIPESAFEGKGRNEILENAGESGIEAIRNVDGSYTFTMSDKNHREMLKEQILIIDTNYDEYAALTSLYPALKNLAHNEDMTVITMHLDQKIYEEGKGFESFLVYALYLEAEFLQILNGVNPENIKVEFILINYETTEIFKRMLYPEYMNLMSDIYDETGW